ncbi:uncharacterized protein EI97DRAFT_319220 [Westerdykella ornata]|uniref:Uncharacterized protein n=1 Tax=Westerdykella ornata TaxID=318751 RepID=A0A6A6JJF7_WESOR|nr:uncharacterized protein EI97DRAFT_319220 [Westerdykella ornata]KAF2276711.1 hypothetical protein EI97DRAFT_319220 [Westerdykella ornata]
MLTFHADEPLFSPEEQATADVDALVNDDAQQMKRDIPIIPPIYEHPRRATPTIPPGFSAPVAHRALTEHSTTPMSRTTSADITPAASVVPVSPASVPSGQGQQRREVVISAVAAPAEASSARPSDPMEQSGKPSLAKPQSAPKTATAESVEVVTQPEQKEARPVGAESPSKPVVKSKSNSKKGKDDIVAESAAEKDVKSSAPAAASPQKALKRNTPAATTQKDVKNDPTAPTAALSAKRQHIGKLDLAVATDELDAGQKHPSSPLRTDTPSKTGRTVPLAASSSVPQSPAAASTGSPVKRAAAPRTIRVVPTPRTETPPTLPAVSTGPAHVPTVDKLRSRQASIASINQPGTPASELISEDTSIITSASVSRASSPPLVGGKVGSAPVRKKTKSQAKKERQERARQMLEEQTLALEEQAKAEPEPEHAPIVGRKTKKKKSTPSAAKVTAAPAKTQAASSKDGPTQEGEEGEPKSSPAPTVGAKTEVDAHASQSPAQGTPETGPKEKGNLTAQAIIADLQKSGELLASTLEFFKPLSSSLAHTARAAQSGATIAPQDAKLHFTQADLEALAKKQPVRLSGPDGKPDSRYLITPQGKFLWGLTKELEDKALELEKHIEELKGPARFHPQQRIPHVPSAAPHAQSRDVLPAIATALKEAGAKLKSGSAAAAVQSMPKIDPNNQNAHQQPAPQQQAPVDAGAYLNQFVIPSTDNPSPNSTRTEMFAVGGPPGAGAGNTSVNIGKIAKAAKVVAEGGTLSNELEGMGVMAADLLGGVVVQGLEWLMNAGLGTNIHQDLSVDGKGNITLGGNGFDVQGFVDAMGSAGGLGGVEAAQAGRRGRRSVLSVAEAEQAMLAAKKEYEALEKKLAALMKRNRKLVGATR